jgi:uncharacterized SAM-binding protein YcdF (DUF218 family)
MILKKRWAKIFLLFVILFIAFFLFIYRFLAKTEIVNSKVMVVEGWVTDNTLKTAAFEFKAQDCNLIITTGGPVSGKDFVLTYKSELRFTIPESEDDSSDVNTIEVVAFGDQLDGEYPHFKLLINDSIIDQSYTSYVPEDIIFKTTLPINKIRYVSVMFDNDGVSENGDRNLAIRGIRLNNVFYSPFANNVSLVFRKSDGIEVQPTYENKIIAAPAPFVEIDRTYESASYIKEALIKKIPGARSLNLVTEGTHARRSWMMYKKALGDDFKIGVIAVEPYEVNRTNWWKSKKGMSFVMTQFAKYLYAQFYFYPFA